MISKKSNCWKNGRLATSDANPNSHYDEKINLVYRMVVVLKETVTIASLQ